MVSIRACASAIVRERVAFTSSLFKRIALIREGSSFMVNERLIRHLQAIVLRLKKRN